MTKDDKVLFKKEYDAFRKWAAARLTARQLDLDEIGLFYDEIAGFAHDAWQARAKLAKQTEDTPMVPVHQVMYLGLDGGGWVDVDQETMQRNATDLKHFHTRTLWTNLSVTDKES